MPNVYIVEISFIGMPTFHVFIVCSVQINYFFFAGEHRKAPAYVPGTHKPGKKLSIPFPCKFSLALKWDFIHPPGLEDSFTPDQSKQAIIADHIKDNVGHIEIERCKIDRASIFAMRE